MWFERKDILCKLLMGLFTQHKNNMLCKFNFQSPPWCLPTYTQVNKGSNWRHVCPQTLQSFLSRIFYWKITSPRFSCKFMADVAGFDGDISHFCRRAKIATAVWRSVQHAHAPYPLSAQDGFFNNGGKSIKLPLLTWIWRWGSIFHSSEFLSAASPNLIMCTVVLFFFFTSWFPPAGWHRHKNKNHMSVLHVITQTRSLHCLRWSCSCSGVADYGEHMHSVYTMSSHRVAPR